MPHDSKGSLLKEGDEVILSCKVTALSQAEEDCNATLDVQGGLGVYKPTINCNSKLCTKVGDSDVAKAAKQGFHHS